MRDPFNKLARLMRAEPETLLAVEQKMNAITGQEGVFEDIMRQIDVTVDRTLAGLGVTRRDGAEAVRAALIERLGHLDGHLYELLDRPDLSKPEEACAKLCATVAKVFVPPPGLFLKRDRMSALLEKYPPTNLLEHFGYATVKDLIDREGFASVMVSLRFTQSDEWMHRFFEEAYSGLTPDDFEEREVDHLVLDTKWLKIAEKFLRKKYHNVSHLKELGIIFVIPADIDGKGATLRLFTLMLHYLHEVPFYANLFRRHMGHPDFGTIFKSLLRGDVSSTPAPNHGRMTWRIVQQYLAKKDLDDPRLKEPHVNPEADHWWRAEDDLSRLSRILGRDHGGLDLGWWTGLDFIGEEFIDPVSGKKELVSFDLIDLLMSLVHGEGARSQYLYHQQEALWNKIFVEYMGRERMQELIEEHIVDGFIVLGNGYNHTS
ncbi:MAG: hypothetical protein IT405_02335 [Candidatus Yanofskybacteria bacterium]|nr:hypothetical protein [Candidatus Yanofskybacteria bacterium]